jgi:tRNA-2-methylthio-N6-dimethylallyladenosine synthase
MRDLPTVCEQLHLPVQAGDDNLLRRMRRLYSVEEYRAKIETAVATVGPRLAVSTDIIVGFCGESEAEFAGTERLLRDVRFDTVHLAAYSVRPGTAAARRKDDIPLLEKKARLNHLLAIQREIAAGRNALYVGATVEVLVDGIAEDGRPYGRTRENKVAWLPAGAAKPGELHTAEVVAANAWQLHVQPAGAAA